MSNFSLYDLDNSGNNTEIDLQVHSDIQQFLKNNILQNIGTLIREKLVLSDEPVPQRQSQTLFNLLREYFAESQSGNSADSVFPNEKLINITEETYPEWQNFIEQYD